MGWGNRALMAHSFCRIVIFGNLRAMFCFLRLFCKDLINIPRSVAGQITPPEREFAPQLNAIMDVTGEDQKSSHRLAIRLATENDCNYLS
jgi:hypothetical protein